MSKTSTGSDGIVHTDRRGNCQNGTPAATDRFSPGRTESDWNSGKCCPASARARLLGLREGEKNRRQELLVAVAMGEGASTGKDGNDTARDGSEPDSR